MSIHDRVPTEVYDPLGNPIETGIADAAGLKTGEIKSAETTKLMGSEVLARPPWPLQPEQWQNMVDRYMGERSPDLPAVTVDMIKNELKLMSVPDQEAEAAARRLLGERSRQLAAEKAALDEAAPKIPKPPVPPPVQNHKGEVLWTPGQ